ncbi:MAG: hypothetical protein LRY67_00085 [Gammaproteobacteria bacterium]|nr:hypothetical protein [Gammaproteobacteria bacterium]
MLKLQELFPSLETPTRSLENWKYTSVNQLLATAFDVTEMRQSIAGNVRLNRANNLYLHHPFAALIAASIEKTNAITVTAQKQKNHSFFRLYKKK